EISRMRSKMSELIQEQEATHKDIDSLKSTLRDLEREMSKIEQTSLKIEIKSLVIDDSLIRIEDSDINRFNLSSISPLYKT
ncbi:unnamed protein product, partial [Rotaria socialis]